MYGPRPIITPLDTPVEILSLDLIKEFVGFDEDTDAEQDKVLPVLRSAAIEQGQQITGVVWPAASYRIDGLFTGWPGGSFLLPLSPVFTVAEVTGKDASGVDVPVLSTAYNLVPSAIDFGRPWAELRPLSAWPEQALCFSVACTAGWEADKLPESIRNWLLNRVATLYDRRTDLPDAITNMELRRYHSMGLLDRWTVRGTPDG